MDEIDVYRSIGHCIRQIEQNMAVFYEDCYPAAASVNNVYPVVGNDCWTGGFWSGQLWLAYEWTGDDRFRKAAEKQLPGYQRRLDERIAIDHHDMGFLYIPSCVAAWKLTGNRDARDTALQAADQLMNRFHEKAGIFQAWGDLSDPDQSGKMIIDCTLNVPLLFWASCESGKSHYREAAERHLKASVKYLVRDDSTTFHCYVFDAASGDPIKGVTAQGASDDSCWTRGQVWGIYGFALAMRLMQDTVFLDASVDLSEYYISHLPEDMIPYWDMVFQSGGEERDSSAAAIAAAGMLELSDLMTEEDKATKRRYYDIAIHSLRALDAYQNCDARPGQGLLLHSVYSKPHNNGVDESTLWGDYFYLEALMNAARKRPSYWYS
ncbi:unsaturated chondroitin disaccharide hydrolase [Alkalispirochaeta americana]|uniref:Unsaturated chondroitin disaccharide hydrolase n=1 Tax=Alkalispirochaeta americana TaxID=159291 RepID=A0A1N6XLW3_9SPIO|nr:glycoside hydrolase family 88 protein [Alkalispirochaeta americana]SIR03366.1 unsaturated chondroitin disaccharide hydrolase [Alkalispirochaeta americana]